MNFKKSFKELEKPIVWVHYGIGTAGIIFVFNYLMDKGIITGDSSLTTYGIAFFITYVLIDRISHGILEL